MQLLIHAAHYCNKTICSIQSTYGTTNATLEAIELLGSSPESAVTVGNSTVKRRLNRDTRHKRLHISDDHSSDSPDIERPAKRRRRTSRQIQLFEDDEGEEEDKVEELDEDGTGDYVDQGEALSEDENLLEEDSSRRRSGRKRKPTQSVIDLSDDDFIVSSDEEDEKPIVKAKSRQKTAVKSKGKKKSKHSLSESSVANSEEDSEVEVTNRVQSESDGFIIDKVLACEVHTQREWKKICWNKNTRFLTHCSIYLPDEEEEKQKEVATVGYKHKVGGDFTTADSEGSEAPKVCIDENDIEDAGEERFLIKWKTLSYLHTSWQTEAELLETEKNAKGKIQRFREKQLRALYSQDLQGDEYFNPEYRSVDRILDIQDEPLDDFDSDESSKGEGEFQYFLVKWKALPYDEITWEREDDVGDDAALEQYNARILRAARRYKKIAFAKQVPQNKRKNFRGYTAKSPPPCKKEQNFQLRDYQLTGVNWLLFNWYQKRNSMLADEMGLGKTVQTVMYINHLAVVERTPQPIIVVAPLSTLGHWQREFDSWTNLNAVVYHGSAAARDVLHNYEFFISEDELVRADELKKSSNSKRSMARPKRKCFRFDVLITTFEMASATDLYKLARIDWQLMVVDEAHRLKNRNSKLSNILHTRYTYENMLLLTGTPLQNNVEELWVLLNFLDSNKFSSKEIFLDSFGELTNSAQVERLHTELKPYLLRRMKEDVEKSLAPKEETIIEVELTVLQKQYYRAIYEKNTDFLSRGSKKGDTPSLMNVLMELRKCCNHPFLVQGVEEREVKRLAKQTDVPKEEIQRQIRESLVDTSGKLVLLDKLLPRLQDTGHRVLIFSQFKIMLDILQDYLALRRYNFERIDGNITGNERQSAIDRFCREGSNSFIMLLSTRAGGVGINLTAADTVIIYDSDWNPQNDLQAQARCHRIGQKKSVKIYRLLTAKTYELHMFHKASLKLGLDQAVLGGIKNDDPVAKLTGTVKASKANDRMSKEEIENLLKHGAYEMFKEQDSEAEAASRQFGEESIDHILSRSTTIVHDPTRNVDGNENKSVMSSFSKATFVSSTNPDEEVDVDDPNFWTKVIGLNGVEEQKKTTPSPLQKRRCRRKVKSYLIDDDKAYMIDDSGDEASSRKKISREFGILKDEEFVISEEDDDDDDDSIDTSMTEGASAASGKQKRTQTPLLPIYYHLERIAELVGTFGYGRWDDMKRHASVLEGYTDRELSQFVQEYITGMVRLTTAAATFERIGLEMDPSQVYMISSTAPSSLAANASPVERYAYELYVSVRRYPFLSAMLEDMQIANMLAVAVLPRLWITENQSRVARGFRIKLQQIDTMWKLSELVQRKFEKASALVSVIERLQTIGNEAIVQKIIETGTFPASPVGVPVKKNEAIESVPNEEKPKKVVAEALKDCGLKSDNKNDEVSLTTDQTQSVAIAVSTKSEETIERERAAEAVANKKPSPAQSNDADSPTTVAKQEVTTNTFSENVPTDNNISKDLHDVTQNQDLTDLPTPGDKKDDESVTATSSVSVSHSRKVEADNEKESLQQHGSSDGVPAEIPILPERIHPKVENEQKQAMQILKALPTVNSPELVAPWWISRVDDVMLLMHVYRDGWIKGRAIPTQMVDSTTLFGDRAMRYPVSEWPTMATLNRRLKMLLHLWTSAKATRIAPSATTIDTALKVISTKNFRQEQLHRDLQQQLQRQHEHQRAQQAQNQRPNVPAHNLRRNQFAKLVFSFGIPDVSTCRDERERNEKWRYFLQDGLLKIGHCSGRELLAEAQDLERVCRQRLCAGADGEGNRDCIEETSILGGKRGIWLLTITQCRRLLHRVELFRLLRTQILVLPPAQLVELVTHVVRVQSASTDYPAWWSSPRHDILLLQGVECYGLDDHLASVWKLPLFNSANTTNSYPSSSWVENYVMALALACRDLFIKARKYHTERLIDLSNDDTNEAVDKPLPRSDLVPKSASRRRILDIQGMRDEDPYFVPSVRLRHLIESNAFRRDKYREELTSDKFKMARQRLTPAEETALMQLEDPYHSSSVRAVWAKQIKHDEIEATNTRSTLSCSVGSDAVESTQGSGSTDDRDMGKTSPPSDATVFEIEKNDGNISGKVAKPHVSSSSSSQRPVRAAAAAAKAKLINTRHFKGNRNQDSTIASVPVAVAKSAQPAAKSWNVIVIDSSDDSD